MSQGYVYLIKADTGHYKIGMSKDVRKRLRVFSVEMPIHVYVAHAFPADNMREAEATLHELYADFRGKGEWFNLDSEAVNYIRGISAYLEGVFLRVPPAGVEHDIERWFAAYERHKIRGEFYELVETDGQGERFSFGIQYDESEVSHEWYEILRLVEAEPRDPAERYDAVYKSLIQRGIVETKTLIYLASEA